MPWPASIGLGGRLQPDSVAAFIGMRRPLCKLALDTARKHDLSDLAGAAEWVLRCLDAGAPARDLIASSLMLGYHFRDVEIDELRRAIQQKVRLGRKVKAPHWLLAMEVDELAEGRNGAALAKAKLVIAERYHVGRSTIEAALKQQRDETDPLGAGLKSAVRRRIQK
jgi:hypothetical protein